MSSLAVIHPNLGEQTLDFIEALSDGIGPLNAALAVGWSPHKLRELMRDPGFRELMEEAQERKLESIEEKAHELAIRGNMTAIQLILYSQGAHRGWRPPTQRVAVDRNTTVKVEVVEGAKAAAIALLESHGAKALQRGGALDEAIDATSNDG